MAGVDAVCRVASGGGYRRVIVSGLHPDRRRGVADRPGLLRCSLPVWRFSGYHCPNRGLHSPAERDPAVRATADVDPAALSLGIRCDSLDGIRRLHDRSVGSLREFRTNRFHLVSTAHRHCRSRGRWSSTTGRDPLARFASATLGRSRSGRASCGDPFLDHRTCCLPGAALLQHGLPGWSASRIVLPPGGVSHHDRQAHLPQMR